MRRRNILIQGVIWLVVISLLVWVLRGVPIGDVLTVFQRFTPQQLILLFAINTGVLLLFGGRWWVILAAFDQSIPYIKVAMHRLAGFGVSYFTPGPQVGGEPVQVRLLRSQHPPIPLEICIASLSLDRLFEVVVNLVIVLFGLVVTLQMQFAGQSITGGLALVTGLIVGILGLFIGYAQGVAPITHGFNVLPTSFTKRNRVNAVLQVIQDSEWQIIYLFQKRPIGVLGAFLFSMLSWAGIIIEYWLLAYFLGIALNWVQLISVLTAFQISFALPLPGGLGSLEAGQVFIYELLELDPAIGLSVSLFMRGRDIIFGLLGLWWAGYAWRGRSHDAQNRSK